MELIQIIIEESENAIDRAFNEGYKHASLYYAPNLERWKTMASQSANKITQLERDRWMYAVCGLGIGVLMDHGISLVIRLQN